MPILAGGLHYLRREPRGRGTILKRLPEVLVYTGSYNRRVKTETPDKITIVRPLFLVLALTLLAGCGGSSGSNATAPPTPAPPTAAPLSAANLNLIFVVSEDLAYQAPGDVNPTTANLTNRGLQRSLRMATFLRQHVLGGKNVTGVYVLEPMTHLQTTSNYPDMAAPETIQQFV